MSDVMDGSRKSVYEDEMARIAESETVEALHKKVREAMQSFKDLEELSATNSLKELWLEKNYAPDDPINFMMEALSIFEARMRAICGQFIAINEAQTSFMFLSQKQVVDSMQMLEESLDRVDEMKAAVLMTQKLAAAIDSRVDDINQNHSRMLDIAEDYSEALGEATLQQRVLNWVSYLLVAAVFLGIGLFVN